jgi:hypothetical protein
MNTRLKKILLLLLAGVMFFATSRVQVSLNQDRHKLGLTRVEPLENAPPVLAFTTVALGGFRGLISNILWMRASDLQDADKFFEMAQLANWITKLEPHYVHVWLNQAWNMAYNISVKFKDYPDRWRWVKKGIELLRDEGLRYNPNETLIYRELGWFFQHKMGQFLDDAHMYYKQQWANEMADVFEKKKPNLDELINPQTPDQVRRAKLLKEKYKMDPAEMKRVDERFGPLEWRLPEAHAIYWAAQGLKAAERNPTKVKKDELITLRRVIYQALQMSFQRGRLIANPYSKSFEFGPNLEIIPIVNSAYEQAAQEDLANHDNILHARKNFLKDAVYFLYEHNRLVDAATWFKVLCQDYPTNSLIDGRYDSLPGQVTLDQYVVSRIETDIGETSRDRLKSFLEGMLVSSYWSLVIDEDDRAAGYKLMARQVWTTYQSKVWKEREQATTLPPLTEIDKEILARVLNPEEGFDAEARAVLRTKLGLPAEVVPPPDAGTNAVPASVTNTAPAKITSK